VLLGLNISHIFFVVTCENNFSFYCSLHVLRIPITCIAAKENSISPMAFGSLLVVWHLVYLISMVFLYSVRDIFLGDIFIKINGLTSLTTPCLCSVPFMFPAVA
jgi:hypothetical protein